MRKLDLDIGGHARRDTIRMTVYMAVGVYIVYVWVQHACHFVLASSPGSPSPLFYSAHANCFSHAHYKKEEGESLGTRLTLYSTLCVCLEN